MHRTCVAAALILVVAAGALAFRLPRLALRPMHTDEAVHTVKAGTLLETGRYVYNPREYHGPTLYYFALPFIRLGGARTFAETNETMFRIVPVLFGVGLILLLLGVVDGLGAGAAVCAAAFTAVSPAMVFYSRYYIQEMLLVCFTFAAIVCGWRYTRSRKVRWALLGGVSVGLMHATKETCAVALVSMAGALLLAVFWGRWRDGACAAPSAPTSTRRDAAHLALALVVAAVVSTVLMSAFFTNPREPLDAVLAYVHYFGRAAADSTRPDGASYHDHPWYYYLQMLLYTKYAPGPWWSEAAIVAVSLAGVAAALRRSGAGVAAFDRPFVRFLVFYTLLMTAIYAVIPYKTPWCLLGFLHGMVLLAGVGAAAIVRALPNAPLRAVALLLLATAMTHLGVQAYRGNYVFYADTRNPYVYGHSSSDVVRLGERIEALAELEPAGHDMLVKVMASNSDYWPLPWYLRRFTHVGYWPEVPDAPDAPVVVASVDFEDTLDAKLHGAYQREYYGLRPEVLMTVYIRSGLWDAFIKSRM